jgi:hypothetical protein
MFMFSWSLDIPRECDLTKPDEAPVAMTVFAIKDIFRCSILVMFGPRRGIAEELVLSATR